MAQTDPMSRQLADELMARKMEMDQLGNVVKKGAKSSSLKRYQSQMDTVQREYDEMGKTLREKVRDRKRAEAQRDIKLAESEQAILAEQERQFQKLVDQQRKEAEAIGGKSIDIEMLRGELKNLEAVLASISEEREKLKVELHSAPRIAVIQPAEVPELEHNRVLRWVLVGMSAMVGFCLPVAGIALLDVRTQRINAVSEISRGLGVPVLGSVPAIPAQVLRRLGAPTKRSQVWRLRLTESVDGIAARLLCKAEPGQARVMLVSSAMPGEGKTTLATQLAMSLARHLRRTLLIDFDLRRPVLDGVFGQPLEPGVCDALRGKSDVGGLVRPTSTEHLSVLTAGRWDRLALASLANGAGGRIVSATSAAVRLRDHRQQPHSAGGGRAVRQSACRRRGPFGVSRRQRVSQNPGRVRNPGSVRRPRHRSGGHGRPELRLRQRSQRGESMMGASSRLILAAVLVACGSLGIFAVQRSLAVPAVQPLPEDIRRLPLRLDRWQGEEQQLDAELFRPHRRRRGAGAGLPRRRGPRDPHTHRGLRQQAGRRRLSRPDQLLCIFRVDSPRRVHGPRAGPRPQSPNG